METMNEQSGINRRQTGMPGSEPQDEMTQLKSELVLMKRKYERLVKKEARLQVRRNGYMRILIGRKEEGDGN